MSNNTREETIARIKAEMREYVTYNEVKDEELHQIIEESVKKNFSALCLGVSDRIEAVNEIFSSIRGLGILDEITNDESITEVMINGPKCIFIEKDGRLQKMDAEFESEEKLSDIIQRIVAEAGREVTTANPIVDTRLSNGSRVNVVMPPIALNGPIVTIRKFSSEPMTFEKLIQYGSVTPQICKLLKELVEAKYNIFISGGTGSGKTTFLNALSNYIPPDERVITIEDSAELQIVNIPNLVRLETRNANSSGVGLVTIRDLIKSALRMRPERIVVGEVRGAEALDMLQAMNTGHDGSLSTGHANSAKDMLSRLETMVLTGGEGLPLPAIRQQIASAVDIIVHLSRMRDKTRKTISITEIVGLGSDGNIILNPLFEFVEDQNRTSLTKVVGRLERTSNAMVHTEKLVAAGKDIGILDASKYQ